MVLVEYRVPVFVEVDEMARRVVSVRVDDEQVEGPVGVLADDESPVGDGRRAVEVAENADWPAWEFGG